MSIRTSLRGRFRRRYDFSKHYAPEPGSRVFRDPRAGNAPIGGALAAEDAPTVTYEPRIDTPETLAEIVQQAQADADAEHEAATAEQQDRVSTLRLRAAVPPPPPMPYPSGMSQIMVGRITYPDPADLSPDKDRNYRDMLRRVGVATGTHTSLEDTGVWALPALEPGDGTGVAL